MGGDKIRNASLSVICLASQQSRSSEERKKKKNTRGRKKNIYMREAKKAAERRQRTASIDSDIQIEEQLKNVRLDGEKSPLTSPTRRDGKRATNAFKEKEKGGEETTTSSMASQARNIPKPHSHAERAGQQEQQEQYEQKYVPTMTDANSYEYSQHGGREGENETFMYARQMYEYEMALRQQMSYATGSPEQMMPFLVGSPPGGPPMPLMGGFDPNEFARMQHAQQMNAAYYAIVPTQEMLDIYATQGMPFPGNMVGSLGMNGGRGHNNSSMNSNNSNSGYYSFRSYNGSDRGGRGGINSRGNSRHGRRRKNNNFGHVNNRRSENDLGNFPVYNINTNSGNNNLDIHGINANNGPSPSEALLRYKMLRIPNSDRGGGNVSNSNGASGHFNDDGGEFTFKEAIGHCVEFSSDQHGSRFIQSHIDAAGDPDGSKFSQVWEEILPNFETLAVDVFGNYVIQKCFERANKEQLEALLGKASGEACLELCLNAFGCRVIQKALDVSSREQRDTLFFEPLKRELENLCCDQNGNHVAQKFVLELSATGDLENFVKIIVRDAETVRKLSSHPFACRVVQRMLEHCTEEQKNEFLLPAIVEKTTELAINQFGNYVVQHSLQYGSEKFKKQILRELATEITSLATHKFASNVIEKCMAYCGNEEKKIMIDKMLGKRSASSDSVLETEVMEGVEEKVDDNHLPKLMSDQYANYVVQKLLEICEDDQFDEFLTRIREHIPEMRKYTYGKHIVVHVERILEKRGVATTETTEEVKEGANA